MRPCAGKERFTSFVFASRLAKRSRRNGETNRHAYRCAACAGFHIGSQQGRRRRSQVEEVLV